jgi:release factor glutamine methyltransferase
MQTVREARAAARALGLQRLDAQLLLAHHLQRERVWLLAHEEAALDAAQQAAFRADCERRSADVPLAYLVGVREFHGLALHVDPAVLVPRHETEILVDWGLALLRGPFPESPAPEVADLGTGSGAIALALKSRHARARVSAVDLSAAAVEVARGNARALALEVEFHVGNWWRPLRDRRFHLVLANPPYVADGDAHLHALRHEPAMALSAGGDGLSAIGQIVDGAPDHLLAGGWLLLEHGHDQADAVHQRLRARGFQSVGTRRDLAGRPRCTGGCWAPQLDRGRDVENRRNVT